MISSTSSRPDSLSGTNGEPALHAGPMEVLVKTPPFDNIFSDVAAVEIYITSESLILYCESTTTRLSITYPQIVLHATSSEPHSLYLQIENDELGHAFLSGGSDYEGDMFEVFLSPSSQDSQGMRYWSTVVID